MNVGFASEDDARRVVDTLNVLSSMFLNPVAGVVSRGTPVTGMVKPKAGSAPAGHSLGNVCWLDPATNTYTVFGNDILIRWAAGLTPDTAAEPFMAQFAGVLTHSGTVYGLYTQGTQSAGSNTVDVPWSWTFDPEACTLSVATVRTLTGNFTIGAEHAP